MCEVVPTYSMFLLYALSVKHLICLGIFLSLSQGSPRQASHGALTSSQVTCSRIGIFLNALLPRFRDYLLRDVFLYTGSSLLC